RGAIDRGSTCRRALRQRRDGRLLRVEAHRQRARVAREARGKSERDFTLRKRRRRPFGAERSSHTPFFVHFRSMAIVGFSAAARLYTRAPRGNPTTFSS